ncbi:MAG TPA: TolC family protein [Cyclobacteriaceae bacterium]|nr:TolC family protein [Cyclobacteriaceae bacterium]
MQKHKFFHLIVLLLCFSGKETFSQSDTVSFSELFAEALNNNFGIRITRNNAALADNSNTLGNAGFLPEMNITSALGRTVNNTKQQFFDPTRPPVERTDAKSISMNAIAELTWTVFDGFRMFATKEKLEELDRIGQLNVRWQIENIYVGLAILYYQLSQEQKLQHVLETIIDISRARLALAEKKFQVGSASELDLNQAKIDFSTDSALLLSHQVMIRNLIADIDVMIGRSPEIIFYADYNFGLNTEIIYEQLIDNLQQQNVDLLIARSQMDVFYQQVRESRSVFLPTIRAYGTYSFSKQENEVGVILLNRNRGYGYGLRLNYNLFNGFNKRMDVENARINYESSEINSQQVLLQSEADLYKTYNGYAYSLQAISLERVNLQHTRQNLNIAFEKYRLGAINEIDFRNIQRTALEAENRLLTAEYQAKIAEINMLQLSGGLSL